MMRGAQGASEVNSDFFIYLTECGWWGGHRESSFHAHDIVISEPIHSPWVIW